MIEMINEIEKIAGQLNSFLLLWSGIVLMFCGLFVWAAGIKRARFVTFLGIFAALSITFYPKIIENWPLFALILAVFSATFGVFFWKKALAAILGLSIACCYIGCTIPPDQIQFKDVELSIEAENATPALTQILDVAEVTHAQVSDALRSIYSSLSVTQIVIAAAIVLAVFAVSFWIPRLISSITLSAIGLYVIIGGMFLLILSKPASPVEFYNLHAAKFAILFGIMFFTGSACQFVLGGPIKTKEKPSEDVSEESGDEQ